MKFDKNHELLQYFDYLTRFASSKCHERQDAEDLVSDTFLAAFAYLSKGYSIQHPKTWLANTFMHKFNNFLREKYRRPLIISLDNAAEAHDGTDFEDEFLNSDECAELRRQLNFLAKTFREVIILYYYTGKSVDEIAEQLGIPAGTVKSRLLSGRGQIRKGLEIMNNENNHIPGRLHVSNSGSWGPKNEPMSLTENDLIAQNLLIIGYDEPLTVSELSRKIGIPAPYTEPVINRLVEGELMVKTENNKLYTDFIIYNPQYSVDAFKPQIAFVRKHFDTFWSVMSEIITKINALDFAKTLNPRQLKKLERYAVTRALQNFQFTVTTAFEFTNPKRRDGGSWTAMGYHFPAQYDTAEYNRVCEYAVRGGHRTSGGNCDCFGAKYLQLCEFDTTLWDHPSRFAVCGFDSYFNDIRKFLWCVYKNIPLEESGVCNDIIAGIDRLVNQTGLIARENGNIIVDIPVIDLAVLEEGVKIINTAVGRLTDAMGDELREHTKGNKTPIPKHLKSVPDAFRYSIATNFIVMGVIREAYGRGLFLHDVDYCCPPVVLVYDKKSVIE